jgi:hypothetical protein
MQKEGTVESQAAVFSSNSRFHCTSAFVKLRIEEAEDTVDADGFRGR